MHDGVCRMERRHARWRVPHGIACMRCREHLHARWHVLPGVHACTAWITCIYDGGCRLECMHALHGVPAYTMVCAAWNCMRRLTQHKKGLLYPCLFSFAPATTTGSATTQRNSQGGTGGSFGATSRLCSYCACPRLCPAPHSFLHSVASTAGRLHRRSQALQTTVRRRRRPATQAASAPSSGARCGPPGTRGCRRWRAVAASRRVLT